MADGVHTLDGPLAQLPAGGVSIAEQGLVTARHQLMEVENARLMVQLTPTQNPATPIRAQVRNSLSVSQKCAYGVII